MTAVGRRIIAWLARYTAPFTTRASREALLRTAYGLHPKGFDTVASSIEGLEVPVRLIYGEDDRILPDVAQTMARVKATLPHAELTSIPNSKRSESGRSQLPSKR